MTNRSNIFNSGPQAPILRPSPGGASASADAAESEARHGGASARQARVLAYLGAVGPYGGTYREIGESLKYHHGQVTGVLSPLHRAGDIACLRDVRRDRCSVYVLPTFTQGRPVREYGYRTAAKEQELLRLQRLAEVVALTDPEVKFLDQVAMIMTTNVTPNADAVYMPIEAARRLLEIARRLQA